MSGTKIYRIILTSLLCLLSRLGFAQGTLNALNISPAGGAVVGYQQGGIGWSFVSTSDILVTAISSTAPQVSFWSGTNQIIASYDYAGPYGIGRHVFDAGAPTNFQSIPSLFLSAGQTYFISTQNTNFSAPINFFFYSLNGTNGILPFNASPYISQFASYYVSTNGQWSSTTSPPSENAIYAAIGPNFQFEPVPEPSGGQLQFLSVTILIFIIRKPRKFPKLHRSMAGVPPNDGTNMKPIQPL